ncbi:DUF551 domain-containing protein [Xenorhabdus bovienii]|uniref:DUF551 domain-containing protein n=1 Tax=Xenorhabdus bovienii TaxID=40576 RepID=UPI00237C5AA8|nr:DUF551 domain-containing protein [Xenorhabdus bovienii]MDE1495697.1 DUF551 domain-containing protein [Xenorhabdus bovienii]MDE9464665.1 DUF551 domain-containing protein [Xenorhabdus bovienii]MDE9475287.1 DUF551 domain-containing protein [Xenorhabdus bovienii]
MDWISVDDRLPKTVGQFEMFIVSTDKGIGTGVYDSWDGFSRITISGNTQHSGYTVTHWMPLPKPPVK